MDLSSLPVGERRAVENALSICWAAGTCRSRLLPTAPEFIFCATDMVFGVNWESTRQSVGNYEAGYMEPPPSEWTLARAVAASSCFPPVFPPARALADPTQMKRGKYRGPDRDEKIRGIELTDGGVYDNLGLQSVAREKIVLCSDGGGVFQFERASKPWSRVMRYTTLLQTGIGKLRKRMLMMDFSDSPPRKTGTYWDIGQGRKSDFSFSSYPDQETATRIANIRTDLNRFTQEEFEVLMNHGYLRAAEKMIRYCGDLITAPPPSPREVQRPYPKWLDPAATRKALRPSGNRLWPHRWR